MNDKVIGFVLSTSDYCENDTLLQVSTKEYGIISLINKSSKKIASKNRLLQMCLYEFVIDYKSGKSIYTVRNTKLLATYFEDKDLEMLSFKNILLEATLKNKDINSFDELCFVFKNINKDNHYLLGSMYFSFLIKKFGITPVVDGCVICNEKKVVTLSNKQGGFLCLKHLNGEMNLPVTMLKKFRLIIKGDFINYDVLKDFDYDLNDFNLVVRFYLENAYLKLKTYDFYLTLN